MTGDALRTVLRMTKALADAQRVRILMMLEPGELCVCQIVEVLSLAPSTVSKHLSILATADLVVSRKEGRWAYYRLPEPDADTGAQSVLEWLDALLSDDGRIRADRARLTGAIACAPGELSRRQRPRTGVAGITDNGTRKKRGKRRMRILFLCTGNSCRSQMAEGWARALKGDAIEVYSAGIEAHGLNPRAVKVMAEVGVDIGGHRSKRVEELKDVDFDYVVTVCGHANETCPMWLGRKAKIVHVGFDDPPRLAQDAKSEEDALGYYRRVRDEIRAFVEKLPKYLVEAS